MMFMHFFPHIHTDNFLLPVSIYTRQINSWSFLVILVGEYRDQTAKGRELRLGL